MSGTLSRTDRERLRRIAATIDAEAQTWAEGFAVRDGKGWRWSADDAWAHVRFVKLQLAAEFLRKLAARKEAQR